MNRSLLVLAIAATFGTASANSFTGFDAQSSALGNTGVASASAANASQFNPALLASYQGEVRFAMTLPSIKIYLDDSSGLISSAVRFTEEGGTLDQFEAVDADAFSDAVFGNAGAGIRSMEEVLGDIANDLADLQAAIDAVENDVENNNSVDESNYTALVNASGQLTNNTTELDGKTQIASEESTKLRDVVSDTRSEFLGLNNRQINLGAGMNILNVALPRDGLAMGISLSNTTTVGASALIVESDFDEVGFFLNDLTGLSNQSNELSGAMLNLAQTNQQITNHIGALPQEDDYDSASEFENDLEAWSNQLSALNTQLNNDKAVVDNEQQALVDYNGTYYSNGEVTAPELEDFESEIEVVGANITEFGITFARQFNYMGHDFAAGITPKLMNITIFERRFGIDDSDAADDFATLIDQNTTSYFSANIDVGVARYWDDVWYGDVRAGMAIKDLIPQNFESQSGVTLRVRPKVRVGAAHLTRWTTVSTDLDITENQPMRYGTPTRYFGLGVEYNQFDWFKLRAGYRNNLSVADSSVVSAGFGITPWGVGLEFGTWFKPRSLDNWDELVQDAGVTAQFSMQF